MINASTQKLSDLCCCVNAFEGYDMAFPTPNTKKKWKIYRRQRRALTNCIIEEAEHLYFDEGVSLRRLTNALRKGGWDDNYFICETGKRLAIKDINGRK